MLGFRQSLSSRFVCQNGKHGCKIDFRRSQLHCLFASPQSNILNTSRQSFCLRRQLGKDCWGNWLLEKIGESIFCDDIETGDLWWRRPPDTCKSIRLGGGTDGPRGNRGSEGGKWEKGEIERAGSTAHCFHISGVLIMVLAGRGAWIFQASHQSESSAAVV